MNTRVRRYRVRQFLDFDTIRVLQRAGTPLCEIRQYLEGRSTENCLRLMREKRLELQEQKEELERMIQMLSHTADMTEFALRQQYDKPQVICMEEQWLAAVALRTGEGDRVESVAKRLREHFASVSYTHLRAHETGRNLVCRLLLEKKKPETASMALHQS